MLVTKHFWLRQDTEILAGFIGAPANEAWAWATVSTRAYSIASIVIIISQTHRAGPATNALTGMLPAFFTGTVDCKINNSWSVHTADEQFEISAQLNASWKM